jgi:hypothetical protein
MHPSGGKHCAYFEKINGIFSVAGRSLHMTNMAVTNKRPVAYITLIEPPGTNVQVASERLWYLNGGIGTLPTLAADNFDTPDGFFGSRPYLRPFIMQFHMWDFSIENAEWEKRKANEIDRVKALKIDVKFLPHDVEILSGSVDIIVNSALRKNFKILPQKDNLENPTDAFSNTTPFVIFATNSSPLNVEP